MRTGARVWLAATLAVGCVEGGGEAPVWVCPVADYEVLEDVGCTCDLPQGAEVPEAEVIERGTRAGIVAPPGTYRPNAWARVVHEGLVTVGSTREDGSLFLQFRHADVDLRGARVRVEVGGAPSAWATLDAVEEAWLAPSRTPHEEFPEGAIVIEEPAGTLWTRAHIEPDDAIATPIEHALWIARYYAFTWLDPAPALDTELERMDPGAEGDVVQLVMLHASGNASGCYAGENAVCRCAVSKRAAGLCSDQPPPPPPPPGDGGVPF
ncbi:hypothetical protein [Sandaracinus amylolyticus]|nr:hypothetical protein [Sandaracinus amylolyticus]